VVLSTGRILESASPVLVFLRHSVPMPVIRLRFLFFEVEVETPFLSSRSCAVVRTRVVWMVRLQVSFADRKRGAADGAWRTVGHSKRPKTAGPANSEANRSLDYGSSPEQYKCGSDLTRGFRWTGTMGIGAQQVECV